MPCPCGMSMEEFEESATHPIFPSDLPFCILDTICKGLQEFPSFIFLFLFRVPSALPRMQRQFDVCLL